MAKSNPQLSRIIKQVLTLAIPMILKMIASKKAQGTSAKSASGKPIASGSTTNYPSPGKAKQRPSAEPLPEPPSRSKPKHKPSPIADLHRRKRSDVIITDTGIIVKVLPDDNEGSRHQRFLVEVDHTDVTIKIAHNIDLAPRVPAREGDRLEFKGEYEYNDLGGAVHWTHHDPKKWREGGWIDHKGKRYE